jgi:glycosyltransferase 2 family protein
MRLGRGYQVPQRASGAAVVVFMLMVVGTGLLVGVPVIPLLFDGAAAEYHWMVLVLPAAMLLAAPPVLNRLIALALRVARRPPLPAPLSSGGILRVAGWSIAAWLFYGVQVFVLARQLGAEGGWLLLVQCTGAFAVAFASGPLLLVVPAGAGVREAALLLLLLGPTITAPRAAVIAVVSRLLFIVGDLAWGGAAVLTARRRTLDAARRVTSLLRVCTARGSTWRSRVSRTRSGAAPSSGWCRDRRRRGSSPRCSP